MRRNIWLLCFIFCCITICAQNPIYIVFTSVDSGNGIRKNIANDVFDPLVDRYPFTSYVFQNRDKKYYYIFTHRCMINDTTPPVVLTKKPDFLKSISYIDWDLMSPNLSKEQTEIKCQEIEQHDTIYFIDRKDFSPTSIKLIQVIAMKSHY